MHWLVLLVRCWFWVHVAYECWKKQWTFQLVWLYTCSSKFIYLFILLFGYTTTPAPDKTFDVGKSHDAQVKSKLRYVEFQSNTNCDIKTSHGTTTQPSSLDATCQTLGNPKCMTILRIVAFTWSRLILGIHIIHSLKSTVDSSKAKRSVHFDERKRLERKVWDLDDALLVI